jgi:LacI family transcriptional regulator
VTQQKNITIEDIARSANVSKSTVSRVLTGNSYVAKEKRKAIEKAMAELNYQPNIFAQGLAGGQSLTVGVLTQNFGSPFYDAILRGIIQGFADSEYSAIFADGRWKPEVERDALKTLVDRRVDGLIVVGGLSSGSVLSDSTEERPLVVVGRTMSELAGHCVAVDNRAAAYVATQHLIEQGHRDIAHIAGDSSQQDAIERQEGYVQAMQDAGVGVNPALIVEGNFRRQSGLMGVEMLLTRGQTFSAIFAANDQMAFGARLALHRRGIRVPDDVSLIGFDDQSDSAYMIPPLTTVSQPAVEMGEAAAKAILDLLKGNLVELSPFPTNFIIRESVARFR